MLPITTNDELGRQIICDYYGCQANIGTAEVILDVLREAVERSQSTLLKLFIHQFSPQGVTAIAIIAESHIIIHTWPEKAYIALDAFTCGSKALPERAIEVVREAFRPTHIETREVKRSASYEIR